jgi:hypothetical protein
MKNTSRVIRVVTRKGIPKNSVAAIARALRSVGDVCVEELSFGLQASAWEILPALVIFYVAKPLFEGFLNELGADGARTLKAKLARFIRHLKTRENRWITRSEIEHYNKQLKTVESPPLPGRLGPTFSIEFQLEHTAQIKYSIQCVFPHGLTDDKIAAALKHLPDDIRAAAERERAKFPTRGHLYGGGTYMYASDAQRWQKTD